LIIVLHDLKKLWKIKRFRVLLTARTLSNICVADIFGSFLESS
jgi:hypothetical protein